MQEHATAVESAVRIPAGTVARRGQNRRFAGEDVKRGGVVFRAGQRVRPAELGMIASLGINEVAVHRLEVVEAIVSAVARDRNGLALEDTEGFNPYKPGFVSGSDSHNAAAPYRQDNFYGGHGAGDGDMKDRLEGLEATHSYFWSRRRAGYPYTEAEVDAKPQATHPLVHVHAGSGRKALFVGAHTRDIVGMERTEGRALIDELIAWCTQPQYIFAVFYKPGDMTIWDNLCSLHRGGEYDDTLHRRDMRRTTVRDPQAPDAELDHFTKMFAAAGDTPFSPSHARALVLEKR